MEARQCFAEQFPLEVIVQFSVLNFSEGYSCMCIYCMYAYQISSVHNLSPLIMQ